jgi:hypothetical protein
MKRLRLEMRKGFGQRHTTGSQKSHPGLLPPRLAFFLFTFLAHHVKEAAEYPEPKVDFPKVTWQGEVDLG